MSDLQQRFHGLARRFGAAGVPGTISDSCVFILSKRHELLRACLVAVLGDASFAPHWAAAAAECRGEYPTLAPDHQHSWCFWRILRLLGFELTLEQVQGHGSHSERLDLLEDLLEFVEECQAGAGAAEQRGQVLLAAAASERFPALCNTSMQLFDPEYARLIEDSRQAHAATDTYIHSIEAAARQMQGSIRELRQRVHPAGAEHRAQAIGELRRAHQECLDAARVGGGAGAGGGGCRVVAGGRAPAPLRAAATAATAAAAPSPPRPPCSMPLAPHRTRPAQSLGREGAGALPSLRSLARSPARLPPGPATLAPTCAPPPACLSPGAGPDAPDRARLLVQRSSRRRGRPGGGGGRGGRHRAARQAAAAAGRAGAHQGQLRRCGRLHGSAGGAGPGVAQGAGQGGRGQGGRAAG
jgi:hypothetical protein